MSILSIENIFQDESNTVSIHAVVNDTIIVIPQTYQYPAEYGPALCEASFDLMEDEILPDNEYELIQFLEKLDLDWNIIDTRDY
jgi:hypothetical protein